MSEDIVAADDEGKPVYALPAEKGASDNLSRLLDLAVILDKRAPLGMVNPDAWTCRYAAEELELRRNQVNSQSGRIAELERKHAETQLVLSSWIDRALTAELVTERHPGEPRASRDDFDHRELLTKLDNISSYGVDDAYGIVAMAARAIKQFSSSSLPPKIQAIVDAAIAWSYCPAAGGYRDGPAVEDTVEHLDMAVHDYTDSEAESPEHPNHWTLGEMRAALTKGGSL